MAEKPFSPSKQSTAFVRETIQTQAINSTAMSNSTNGTNSTNELIREAEILEKGYVYYLCLSLHVVLHCIVSIL